MLKKVLIHSTALFLLMSGPAQAMPAVIGGIGALIGGIGAGGLSLGSVAIGLASMGAQWLISKMLTPEPKQRGIKTRMETGGDNPPRFIVGERATPGQLVYANTLDKGSNIPEACLVYVICLSCLPITAVSNEVFISNERCTIKTSETHNGFYPVDEYIKGGDNGGYCLMKFHTGGQTVVDPWLKDKFGHDPDRPWKDEYFLPGCAYAIVQCWYSNRGIWTGLPDFRFVVRGAPLYDPRKDSTVGGSGSHRWNNPNTWSYSENPKVITYNTIRGFWWDDKHVWGGKAEAYRLPLDYWFAAMNACDENVEKKNGDIINRFEIGADISLDDKPIEFIIEVDKSCNGYTTEFGGTYKTWCGGPGLPIATITDDDFMITAEMESVPFQPRQNSFNTCYTSYPEPKEQWEMKDGPRYRDNDAVDEDGEELPLDLALPLVDEANQVQRIARAAIKDSRREVTHAGQLPPIAWTYEPFDCLAYQSVMFGYAGDGKTFFVSSKEDLPNVNQQTLLREVNPDDDGWIVANELDFDVDPLVVVKPGDLELEFTVSADEVTGPAGRDRPAILVEWDWAIDGPDAGDLDVRYIDWRFRRDGTTKWITGPKITDITAGEALVTHSVLRFGLQYEVQFRPVPFANRVAAWGDVQSVTMLAVEVPTGLSLAVVTDEGADGKLDFFVLATWTDVSQLNNGYGVKLTVGANSRVFRADENSYPIPVKAPSSVSVQVRTRAADGGTPGAYCTAVPITVNKKSALPTGVAGLTVDRGPKVNRLKWNRSTDADFKEYIVLSSTTNSLGTATEIGRTASNHFNDHDVRSNGQKVYYWVYAVNRSDNSSASAATANGDYSLVIAGDTDATVLAAPSVLVVSQLNRDLDKDGTVDIALQASISSGPTGATSYEFAVYWATSAGGSYTLLKTIPSPTGIVSFDANTQLYYKVQARALSFNNTPGTYTSLSSAVQPLPTTGAPANPTSFIASPIDLGFLCSWGAPTELDFSHTEIAVLSSPGTPSASQVVATSIANYATVLFPSGSPAYVYCRHVNTSKLPSSWVLNSLGAVTPQQSGAVSDWNNIGTSGSGNVNAGAATSTILLFTAIGNSNTAGVTFTLGSKNFNLDIENGKPISLHRRESGGGSFSYSKSGGSIVDGQLIAIACKN